MHLCIPSYTQYSMYFLRSMIFFYMSNYQIQGIWHWHISFIYAIVCSLSIVIILFLFIFFKTRSSFVSQAGLPVLLPPLPEYWDYMHVLPHLACSNVLHSKFSFLVQDTRHLLALYSQPSLIWNNLWGFVSHDTDF
jgi:hypothetical protein